ncbi:MAG TPA: cupin domain-containing protein [Rhodanobacteraceae bacterium]|jgi:mannose-6-phosphate isomerase-like protein (cupin superfamily)|nr:cupin domain-containing protein [Rhodanobacteraceae bacterium]
MRSKSLQFAEGFRLAPSTPRGQVAEMTLRRGASTGGPDNSHPRSDQWLYVVAGNGEATVDGRNRKLDPGTLLLIEKGESHEIRNTGTTNLQTLTFYAPPAY